MQAIAPVFTDLLADFERFVGGAASLLDDVRADELWGTGACSRCSSSGLRCRAATQELAPN